VEFDTYAENYDELLKDPLRDWFAGSSGFFHERKWLLIEQFCRTYFGKLDYLDWLDIGCGRGELLSLGRQSFRHVAGCDVSERMLKHATACGIVHQPRIDQVPFPDARFDLVTAVCVYHHVQGTSRMALTAEAKRVLRPGGVFCLIEHNPLNPATRLIVHRSPVDQDAVLLRAATARALMKAAGLEVAAVRYFLLLPPKIFTRLRALEERLSWLPLGGQYAIFASKPVGN
jgi:SAM-dependent methyltransferase